MPRHHVAGQDAIRAATIDPVYGPPATPPAPKQRATKPTPLVHQAPFLGGLLAAALLIASGAAFTRALTPDLAGAITLRLDLTTVFLWFVTAFACQFVGGYIAGRIAGRAGGAHGLATLAWTAAFLIPALATLSWLQVQGPPISLEARLLTGLVTLGVASLGAYLGGLRGADTAPPDLRTRRLRTA